MSGMALQDDAERRAVRRFELTTACESLGDSLSRNLLPIVAVSSIGAGSAAVGAINSLGMLAFLILGVPIGALADRLGRPLAMMTASTLVRAVVVFLLPVMWLAGWLAGAPGFVLLIGAALIIGVADVGFTTGQGLLVPELVGPTRIRPLFGKVQSISQIGNVAGASILTAVLAIVAAPLVWWASASFYLASSIIQRFIQPGPPNTTDSEGSKRRSERHNSGVRAGVRHLFAQPLLRKVTVANTLTNGAVAAANTLLPVFALTVLGLEPAAYAAVGMCGAVAGIAGAASAAWISERIGLRAARLLTGVGMSLGVGVVMLLGLTDGGSSGGLPGAPILWLGVQSVLAGFCSSVAIVAGSDLPARLSKPEQLGTVMGAQRTLVLGIIPVVSLIVGLIGGWAGLATASYIWLGLAVAAVFPWAVRV